MWVFNLQIPIIFCKYYVNLTVVGEFGLAEIGKEENETQVKLGKESHVDGDMSQGRVANLAKNGLDKVDGLEPQWIEAYSGQRIIIIYIKSR